MKKYFMLLAAAATVLAVSCNKEKEQPKVDPTPGTEIEDNTPQPIRFGVSTVEVKSPITKAAIENTTAWPLIGGNPQKLYIYGFELDNAGAPQIAETKAILNNVPADAPTAFTGTNAAVNGDQRQAIVVKKANDDPYYYGENGQVYSFYGYYVGSAIATPTPTIASSKVSLDLTIDGSQDIMLATTDKFADYIAAGSPSVSLEKVYSEVSARKTVKPDLKFKHQLARFKFETKYGGATEADGAKITIDTLLLKSLKAGTLTIAAADEDDLGFVPTGDWGQLAATDTLILRNANGSRANGKPGSAAPNYGTFYQFGESIMTFPQGMTGTTSPKYTVHIGITQDDGTASGHHFSRDLEIDFASVVDTNGDPIVNKYAEAGKMYVIRLVIYGAEKIEMTVSLEDWEYGGETQIDPDQDPRPVPAFTFTAPADPNANLPLTVGTPYQIVVASASYTAPGATDPTQIPSAAIKFGTTNKKIATVAADGTITPVKAGTCKIYVYVEATENYQGVLKAINAVVSAPAAPLPVPGFTGLQTADINATGVATNAYVTGALFTSCQYGTTPTDVAPASISIEVSPAPASGSITYNTADKTITVAQGTTAGTYAVTLKVAASAGVHQAYDATPFNIVVTD